MNSFDKFMKADTRNLPEMDVLMISEYVLASEKYSTDEIKSIKKLAKSQNEYFEDAIGFVQLRRRGSECEVNAKVLPEAEDDVNKKYYMVTVKIEEQDNTITAATCDCRPDSTVGCKHTLMFLNWLQKKATIPERAPVQCFWHKPLYGLPPLRACDMFKSKKKDAIGLGPRDPRVLKEFIDECKRRNIKNSLIMRYQSE